MGGMAGGFPVPLRFSKTAAVIVSATDTAGAATIPNASGGAKARYVLISTNDDVHIRPGETGETFDASNSFLLPADSMIVLNVLGFDIIRHDCPAAGTATLTIQALDH